jgi:hypothetical protein
LVCRCVGVVVTVRFASFNVENLFARPKALNQQDWADGQPALDAFARFNGLIEKPKYTSADKQRMIELLLQLETHTRAPIGRGDMVVDSYR